MPKRNIEEHRAKRARDASKRCLLSDGKINLKSATAAAGLPTDRLHNHRHIGRLENLISQYFRGEQLIISGEAGSIYGGVSQ